VEVSVPETQVLQALERPLAHWWTAQLLCRCGTTPHNKIRWYRFRRTGPPGAEANEIPAADDEGRPEGHRQAGGKAAGHRFGHREGGGRDEVRPEAAAVARRPVGAKSVAEFSDVAAQFVVGAAKLFAALEFIGCEAEACQHSKEKKAVPELQSPTDGFENHAQLSMQ